MELATWIKPRVKGAANAANAAAGAGTAMKVEVTTGSFSSFSKQDLCADLLCMCNGLAGGSDALAVCLLLHAELGGY